MRIGSALLVTALLVGCGSTPEVAPPATRDVLSGVRDRAEAFASDLRWGRYDDAARNVHPERRDAFRSLLRRIGDDLRFTSYAVEEVAPADGAGEIRALVSFTLYRVPRIEEETLYDEQRWAWDGGRRSWFLLPDLARYAGEPEGPAAR